MKAWYEGSSHNTGIINKFDAVYDTSDLVKLQSAVEFSSRGSVLI